MKKLIAAWLVLLILVCMATASASTGSIDNPLITRSYLNGAFSDEMRVDIEGSLDDTLDTAVRRLDDIYRNHIGYSFAPGYTFISVMEAGTLTLSAGGSFILLTGSAMLTVANGTVINVSDGSEAFSGQPLAQFQRYFCTENTTAIITAVSSLTGQVDGYYLQDTVGSPPDIPGQVTPQHMFTDVAESDWFYNAVDFVFRNGLFAGTTVYTFSPGTAMTRGMFVTVLHRLDGLPETSGAAGFADVGNPAMYYYDAVLWANANGIVTGYADGTFQPGRSVSREEMAAIMHRYASYKNLNMQSQEDALVTFPDRGEVSTYAVAALRWAVSWAVIRGSGGRLLPRNTATRAEVAQIIYNYCEKVG